ncbi:hypothetical protein HS088_TW09G01075 [Tripterygium wilfordii]|uniref:Oxidative stress 3 n=1 Tax=Tripterygium wilfordii TaxID=458696 RepID=A0A7J7D9J1_TRIWF|nr:uncharacterized protein LOC120006387 [Tripterygium wilfordii]KAF5743013.1 hypothetical protein HS088_TW09G01075 [Tripterygium wilfordii]
MGDLTMKQINVDEDLHSYWLTKMKDDHHESISSESSMEEASTKSFESSSSLDLAEDATSSITSNSSQSSSNGPLYELSELMTQLPIKRAGLSKYYQGKSESFTSLDRVQSVEDLAKKESAYSYRIKMKSSKSYGGDLDAKKYHGPKATISKKISRGSFTSSSLLGKRSLLGCRPSIHVQKRTCNT